MCVCLISMIRRSRHLIPVVIQGDPVGISSAREGDLFSRAMLRVVLVLRLICGDPIILRVLRISVIPGGVVWILLGGAISVCCASVRRSSVAKDRIDESAVLRAFFFESHGDKKNACVGEKEAELGDDTLRYLSLGRNIAGQKHRGESEVRS